MRSFITCVAAAAMLPLAWSIVLPTQAETCAEGTSKTVTSYIGKDKNVLVTQTFCDVGDAPVTPAIVRKQVINECGTPCKQDSRVSDSLILT